MAKGDLSWIAGVLCSGMGLTFVACGLWFFHRTCTFLATAATAWGEVIDLETRRAYGRQGKRSYVYSIYHPVVRFPLPDGEMVQFTSQIGSTPPEFQVGQSVKVLYHPAQPQSARIQGFWELWGQATFCAGLGVILLFFGVMLLR
jgi:hypothetical protein